MSTLPPHAQRRHNLLITVNNYRRQALLTYQDVRSASHGAIDLVRAAMPFTIDAWVLMPDHLHVI
jgi:putative transposase